MIILLVALYFVMDMGFAYLIGIGISAVLLTVEHYIVSPGNEKKMKIASYNINQMISPIILFFTILDMFI